MTDSLAGLVLLSGVSTGKNIIGLVIRPYETMRRIIDHGSGFESVWIGMFGAAYFGVASLVKEASFRPFLLTKQFILLSGTAGASFFVVGTTIFTVGRIVQGKGTYLRFLLGWGYTMVPTILWFLSTSILYVLLPPPRTTRIQGISFSIVYLVFSSALLFWKILLGYLTIRFGLRLGLAKIGLVASICLPILVLYSIFMYRLGVFKVPFI